MNVKVRIAFEVACAIAHFPIVTGFAQIPISYIDQAIIQVWEQKRAAIGKSRLSLVDTEKSNS